MSCFTTRSSTAGITGWISWAARPCFCCTFASAVSNLKHTAAILPPSRTQSDPNTFRQSRVEQSRIAAVPDQERLVDRHRSRHVRPAVQDTHVVLEPVHVQHRICTAAELN